MSDTNSGRQNHVLFLVGTQRKIRHAYTSLKSEDERGQSKRRGVERVAGQQGRNRPMPVQNLLVQPVGADIWNNP